MKRTPELQALSHDHHHGLALARRAKRAAEAGEEKSVREAWAEVETKFESELEPHFQIEEALIAPALELQGESELTRRLHSEHEALRRCALPQSGRTRADLERFGKLLEAHIRFEESEFFEVAQQRLSADALHRISEACRARQGKA